MVMKSPNMPEVPSSSTGARGRSSEQFQGSPDADSTSEVEAQLAELSRLAVIGELSAEFSHEVSNPLTVIFGELELMQRSLPHDNPLCKNLKSIQGAVRRIEAVAARTLGFSPRRNDHRENCELIRVIEDARRFVDPYLKSQNVWFQFTPPTSAVSLGVSESLLGQVLVNLFKNAVDAMSGSPERMLKVRVFDDSVKHQVQLEIEDSGKGIPDKDLETIFERFYTTKGSEGNGLGLHIARKIVENDMNGKLTARNDDQTTTFTIILPR